MFLVAEREISTSGERGGRAGVGERGNEIKKKRCMIFNSKRVADDICDLFKCIGFQNIFSVVLFY
jgi:hypothetical protein